VQRLTRYPDINYVELKNNLISYLGCLQRDNLVLGNGAAEVIDLAISCFKKILIVVPSFVEYELNAKKWGCHIQYSYLDENMDLDYEDIFKQLQSCEAVIIGNPNNPNGGVVDKQSFRKILNYAEHSNKTIMLDEAFIEFTGKGDLSFNEEVNSYNCLFIIKALTKFFALPGIRFGYGISSNKALITKIKSKQNPWNVNCFAEVAAKYVLKDREYIEASLKWIGEEIKYFPERLRAVSCIERVYETKCNYVLCKLKGINAEELYDICKLKGIIIRKASNFTGLDGSYIRLAIKDRGQNEIVLKVLREC
jgi:threonine-phosphate decarboxylase